MPRIIITPTFLAGELHNVHYLRRTFLLQLSEIADVTVDDPRADSSPTVSDICNEAMSCIAGAATLVTVPLRPIIVLDAPPPLALTRNPVAVAVTARTACMIATDES